MFRFKKSKKAGKPNTSAPMSPEALRTEKAQKNAQFGVFQAVSSGQRSATGDRSELCAGTMNNNQRLATLQMLRNMKDN